MTTRAATAAAYRNVKQRLVKVLFSSECSKQGREAHRRLDSSSYSYQDLKKAYIQKVQIIHPDKIKQLQKEDQKEEVTDDRDARVDSISEPSGWRDVDALIRMHGDRSSAGHEAFVELQNAWDAYDKIARTTMKAGGGGIDDATRHVQNNFTMFGVGCSFSDSPTEQMHRTEIMDQASRGWFSSGQLTENNINRDTYSPKSGECEDDVKKPTWTIPKELDNENSETKSNQSHMHRSKKKSLIDHMIPRNKR